MDLSLAGVASTGDSNPLRSSSLVFSAPTSDVAFDGTEELAAVLAPAEAPLTGRPALRIIFIAGALGGGVFVELEGVGIVPKGGGLIGVSFDSLRKSWQLTVYRRVF